MDNNSFPVDVATEHIIRMALEGDHPYTNAVNKRHGAVFSPTSSIRISQPQTLTPKSSRIGSIHPSNATKTASVWHFVASRIHSQVSNGSSSSGTMCSNMTAAQEIAARYRAIQGEKEEGEREHQEVAEEVLDEKSVYEGEEDEPFVEILSISSQSILNLNLSAPKAVTQPRYSAMRAAEVEGAAQEAYKVMQRLCLTENDPIICQRPGCYDKLVNVKALKFHLHVHNISDGLFICCDCNRHYENSREMDMHICRAVRPHPTPRSTSPVIGAIYRIFANMTCHTDP